MITHLCVTKTNYCYTKLNIMKASKVKMNATWSLMLAGGMLLVTACEKDEIVPQAKEEEKEEVIKEIVPKDESTATFVVETEDLEETETGFAFDGTLSSKTSDGETFEIGVGDFTVTEGADGEIVSIVGKGMPAFPDVGVYAELLKKFAWETVQSHMEYATGAYYKEKFSGLDIPLADDRFYIHFMPFDESKDGAYGLRSLANSVIYNFSDLYIDPTDPSVFFKLQLYNPAKASNPGSVITKFWDKIKNALQVAGKAGFGYVAAPGMTIGISNHAYFKSTEYEFSLTDDDAFRELYSVDRFESINSHLYLKLKNVPIPETVILRLTGEMFLHEPVESLGAPIEQIREQKLSAFLNWFSGEQASSEAASFTGSIDPGGKGIGFILNGVLPVINSISGKDLFNEDINLDLAGAMLQYQLPALGGPAAQNASFLRFGGEIRRPLLMDIFSDEIKQYLISQPSRTDFIYFNVGPKLEDASLYLETGMRMALPGAGEVDLLEARIMFNKDGVNFTSDSEVDVGPLHLSNEKSGRFVENGFELHTVVDRDITLANGIVLASNHLNAHVSSETGFTLDGSINLPYGLGEGEVTGRMIPGGHLEMEGFLKADATFDLGNGLELPTADMTFRVSSDPSEGIYLKGMVKLPHVIDYIAVEGYLHKDDFSLTGTVNNDVKFGSVTLSSRNGVLMLSKTEGAYLKSTFALGEKLGERVMEGYINAHEIKLSGTLKSSIPIGGHNFPFANGKVSASNLTGISISGRIDLYKFTSNVSGKLTAINVFDLTGSSSLDGTYIKCSISVRVRPSQVGLTGTGKIYGLLGNEIYSGSVSFEPNWADQSMKACYSGVCISI